MKSRFNFAYLFTFLFFSLALSAAAQGKSLAEIKKDIQMPEYADWSGQDRFGLYIDVAYKSVKK